MAIYPVIMCGGAGTRLWPSSRPSRPKQFIPLVGGRSLFQETVLRVAPLTKPGGALIIVGGVAHRDAISHQLAELGVTAQVLLEPEARDSAAAMAAAAGWTARLDPAGINVFVASDHHIPDHVAFRAAVLAAAGTARTGRVVTLGVKPDKPSTAFGYIAAAGSQLSDIRAFVEKPDAETAERYIADGYLWNSGNFIVRASVLIEELRKEAPAVAEAALSALPPANSGPVATLLPVFITSPKVSIDYAMMEKTKRASVLAVDFAWSDLGAWDAVAATGGGNLGVALFEDVEGCIARAPDGVVVAAIGLRNLAVIVEPDAVLVCDMSRSQDVKKIVERLRSASPRHLDFSDDPPVALEEGGVRFTTWLRLRALPLWSAVGQRENGAFAELLSLDGHVVESHWSTRVQGRQIIALSLAGRQGWEGQWRRQVNAGLSWLESEYARGNGLPHTLLSEDGGVLDTAAALSDQAFYILARAAAARAGIAGDHSRTAVRIRDALSTQAQAEGELIHNGARLCHAAAYMHLLEACLAWEEAGGDLGWAVLADRVVELAQTKFIDAKTGLLRESVVGRSTAASADDGHLIEPGHQFEWAWLLARYARARMNDGLLEVARCLHARGEMCIDHGRQVAVDSVNNDGVAISRPATLRHQTGWMKSAILLAQLSQGAQRTALIDSAAAAQRAVWRYLTPDGLWREKLLEDGSFLDEAVPASSFHHIIGAWLQLSDSAVALKLELGCLGQP